MRDDERDESLAGMPDTAELAARLRAAGCVYAEDEARLLIAAAEDAAQLERMVQDRVDGRPLEYILGWAEFRGLRITVSDGVFVPRHRSEALVRAALDAAPSGAVVLDLCCGSGAIGAALLAERPDLELHATDIDPAAVADARRNLPAAAMVYEGDLFDPLPERLRGGIQVLVANAPYVPTGSIRLMPAESRLHEASLALDGGADGLDPHRRIAREAEHWLAPRGRLLIETSEGQAQAAAGFFAAAGLTPAIARDEELDATVVIGRRATAATGTPAHACETHEQSGR
jgi:release factor glutamine methyltransferase